MEGKNPVPLGPEPRKNFGTFVGARGIEPPASLLRKAQDKGPLH